MTLSAKKADYFQRNSAVADIRYWFYLRFSHENARRPIYASFMIKPIMTDFGTSIVFGM